jgi:CxxC-x17-CxxC domain-containing protein
MKNESNLENLIHKLQEQLTALDQKVSTLINRHSPEVKQVPKPFVPNTPSQVKPHDRHHQREQYKAICADCQKECTIPFKPSGDRPVYCKDCFSRRKVISLSGIKINEKPPVTAPLPAAVHSVVEIQKPRPKKKAKPVVVKKTIAKKKAAPKKK